MNSSHWIRSRTWDGFWIMSGFWIPTLFLLLPADNTRPVIVMGTLLFWIAHRLSSLYLAICVGEYREVVRRRWRYFALFPLCVLGLLAAFLLVPESIIHLSVFRRFVLLAFADYFLSLYHFSSQHYGVLSVYRGKLPHGQKDSRLLRWDWWICIGVSGIFSLPLDYFNGQFDDFQIFSNAPILSDQAMAAVKLTLTALVVTAWLLTMRKYAQKQQGIARALYFSTLCYMTITSFYLEPVLYFFVVQLQHWLVALALTTHMAANSRLEPGAGTENSWYRPWAWINGKAFGPLIVLVMLSIFLTPLLEADYFIQHDFDPAQLTVGSFLTQIEGSPWIYVLGCLALFSAFIHYIYDRGVFRFSDPQTRKAALPLLAPLGIPRSDSDPQRFG